MTIEIRLPRIAEAAEVTVNTRRRWDLRVLGTSRGLEERVEMVAGLLDPFGIDLFCDLMQFAPAEIGKRHRQRLWGVRRQRAIVGGDRIGLELH